MAHSKEQIREREALAQFGLKRCSKCRGVKPRVNFGRAKERWDGLKSQCRDCYRRYCEANKGAIAEQQRQYYQQNREAKLEHRRQYYEANREKALEQRRQHYEANREAVKEGVRQYYRANKESRLEQKRQYYEANREKVLEQKRQYSQTPEGRAADRKSKRKRRALKRAVQENFTAEDEAFVFERDGHKCVDCGITNQEHLAQFGQRLHIDHVLPLSKGHALTRENAALRCRSCNSRKKDR